MADEDLYIYIYIDIDAILALHTIKVSFLLE